MGSELEFNNGYLVTQIKQLEKDNIRISKQNLQYKKLIQNGIASEKLLQDVQDTFEIINTHCTFLKSSKINNQLIKNCIANLEFNINEIIDKISKNLEIHNQESEDFFKNKVET